MARDRSLPSAGVGTRRRATRSLAVRRQPGRPLNRKQQVFNRLAAAVEELRIRLDADRRRLDDALVFHAQHVRSRLERVIAMRKDLVRALRLFIDDRRLKRSDKRELRTMLAEQLGDGLRNDGELGDDLRASSRSFMAPAWRSSNRRRWDFHGGSHRGWPVAWARLARWR